MAVNWMEVQALATAALVATSTGAIVYAGMQLRHEREYRNILNLEKHLSFFLSAPFAAARQRMAGDRVLDGKLLEFHKEKPPASVFEVLDFYEHLGMLVRKGHLNVDDVWHTFYEWAQPVYADVKPMIEDYDSPYLEQYPDLRRLMHGMDGIQRRVMSRQKVEHWTLWTPERILKHYEEELGAREAHRSGERRAMREARLELGR